MLNRIYDMMGCIPCEEMQGSMGRERDGMGWDGMGRRRDVINEMKKPYSTLLYSTLLRSMFYAMCCV